MKQSIWLSPSEAAVYIDVPVSTLKRWRASRVGPQYAAPSRRMVRYRRSDLDDWLAGHLRETDSSTSCGEVR